NWPIHTRSEELHGIVPKLKFSDSVKDSLAFLYQVGVRAAQKNGGCLHRQSHQVRPPRRGSPRFVVRNRAYYPTLQLAGACCSTQMSLGSGSTIRSACLTTTACAVGVD